MIDTALTLLVLALVAYALATVIFVGHFLSRSDRLVGIGLKILTVGLVLHGMGKAVRFAQRGVLPVSNSIEALNLLALVVGLVFVWVAKKYKVRVLGAFVTPFCLVTLAASLAFQNEQGVVPAALKSAWFPIHLGFAITADALIVVAGVVSLAFVIQERKLRKKDLGSVFKKLPPLHVLDEICHRLLVVGFLLMTAGMAFGSYLAKQQWGAYWSWDPRQTLSMLTWLIFAAILHARIISGWQGRRAAYMTIAAATYVVVSIVALQRLTSTLHAGTFS